MTDEKYILDESSEIEYGENPLILKFFSAFPALKHVNYRLYFAGQFISLTGTWLQTVAQGWLVLSITNSAFWVGAVAALSAIPSLIFGLFAGVLVDRFSKKTILMYTQGFQFLLALILGILTVFNIINLFMLCVLVTLLGAVSAVDLPARQAFTVEIIDRKDLTSAIALNAGTFNAARVLGPGFAGILIAMFGVGGAFIINAISFLAVIIALIFTKISVILPTEHSHPLKAVVEGIVYSYKNVSIRLLLFLSAVVSVFGWSYIAIMPVVVKEVFFGNASMLGYFYAVSGVGSVLGTILVSMFSKKVSPLFFIISGNILFAVTIIIFTLTNNVLVSLPFLFLSGLGIIVQFATINSSIQHIVKDNIRGRVMSIYTLSFLTLMPLGSFVMGFVAEQMGSQFAVRIGGIATLILGSLFYFLWKATNSSFSKTNL